MNSYPDGALRRSLLEHQDFVRRLARTLAWDPSEADDIAQEVWVRALERQPRTEKSLKPWLGAALRGTALNRQRSARRRREHEKAAAVPELEPVERLGLRQEVVEAVLALDEPYRRTVVLAYELGLSTQEIAEREEITPGTVRTRLHRAHERLRRRLAGNGNRRDRLAALAAGWPVAQRAAASHAGWGVPVAVAATMAAVAIVAGAAALWPTGSTAATVSPITRQAAAPGEMERPDPLAELAAPITRPQAPEPAERVALQSSAPPEDPYWTAVRATRASIPRHTIDESKGSAALRARLGSLLVENPPLPKAATFAEQLTRTAKAHAVPVQVSAAAPASAPESALWGAEWLVPARELPVGTWLDLVLAVHHPVHRGGGLSWEFRDGVVEVATVDALLSNASQFEFRIDDLYLSPSSYYPIGEVPPALYGAPGDAHDILTWLVDSMGELYSENLEASVTEAPWAIRWRHTPRSQVRVQAALDQFRAFRQPLPENGPSGQRFRSPASPENARALAALEAEGGAAAILKDGPDGLTQRLRSLGSKHGVGVIWTAAARTHQATPAHLALEVLHGTLLLRGLDECSWQSRPTLWLDLRGTLDPENVPADIHENVAPATWDQDPRNTIRLTADLQLIVDQAPWVLDEIEQRLARRPKERVGGNVGSSGRNQIRCSAEVAPVK